MSRLVERGAAVAHEILDARDPDSEHGGVLVTTMLVEAFARGFVDGLEHAGDVVRIEIEATRGELDGDAGAAASPRGVSVSIELGADDAAAIATLLEHGGQRADSTHGPLTLETLAAMLLEDVALAVRRPGSWEGSNMAAVLASHGYES